ncbi:MAG: ErfK/YbiS/YcfS/YnhG family protein [Hyphomicrobiales bacterium]|nr:ErfK/YbiS/YcfS/YnhG family protein [Hyphomicrobiales bacterium]
MLRLNSSVAVLALTLACLQAGSASGQDAAIEPREAPPAFSVELPPEAPTEVKTEVAHPAEVTVKPQDTVSAPAPAAEVVASEPSPRPSAAEAVADVPVQVPMPPEVVVDLSPPAAPVSADSAAPAVDPVATALRDVVPAFAAREPVARGAAGQAQRRVRESVASFYEQRDFAPVWLQGSGWNVAALSVIARLERAADDALDLAATPVPAFPGGHSTRLSPAELAAADLALSEAVVGYARQASGGRIDPRSISSLITMRPEIADPARVLADVSSASEPGAVLAAQNPSHRGYAALRDKLAEVRRERGPAVPVSRIPAGPVLKVGMKDERVRLIRARFGLDAAAAATESQDLVYDTRVAEAVAGFQKQNGIPASGTLTARTIAALSGGQPNRLEDEIVANMEIWRWMPRDMGADRIEVNIPDYMVRVFRGDRVVHEARVIVGKPNTPTPVFSDAMRFLIVNPYWNVPPSILKKEMLPKLAADPMALQRMGYEVIRRNGQISVRQPPGERNALGWIKFMFPNDHAVYLHDTPSRGLFNTKRRAYSHGCVRVDQPFALAETVLGEGWTEDRVKRLKGGGERTVKMPKPLPIHLGYFPAFVDDAGKLQLREDIYGHSRKVKAALGLAG